mgnify:CR=1 FL=1
MDHAKTIAMATDLLAEGRAEDVVQMVDPLLGPVEDSPQSTGQLLLRGLRAQVEVLHRNQPGRVLDLLPSLSTLSDRCTCVRAEVALWRGWAHARRHTDHAESIRAVRLLDQAETLFDSIHDPRGRCWAMLGRAQACVVLEEYALMRSALEAAHSLVEQLDNQQADRWLHTLSIPALRVEGRYDEAETHLHALRALGRQWNDQRLRGTATAYEAALRYDLGQSPVDILDTAKTAEALLRQSETRASSPLLTAYHAHVGALLRQGQWTDAHTVLDEAESAVRDDAAGQARITLLRIRLAVRRGRNEHAEDLLVDLEDNASPLPHGRNHALLAMLRGRLRARQNQLGEAYRWMQRAHRNARETGHRGRQLRTLLLLARIAAARSDNDTAQAHLDAADEYDDYFSVLPFAARRFATEGTIAQSTHRPDDATDAYRHALSAATMIQDRYRTASLQLALAQLEEEDRAHALASGARATFDALDAPEEAEVATALAHGAESDDDPASMLPHPLSSSDSALTETLARASLSVPLVANAWLQTVAALVPDRWVGVYRVSSDGIASLLHEHGTRPERIQPPSDATLDDSGPARWFRLRSAPPTLVLGVAVGPEADSNWDWVRNRIEARIPLVRLALERALLHQRAHRVTETTQPTSVAGLVTESDAMQAVAHRVTLLRSSAHPVLITGERGVGKRIMARVLHTASPRAEGPLRHVACATMQQDPLTERLFGTAAEDGTIASTGAVHEADGGTLLIEDVDALPPSAQAALLHLLNTGEVVPDGGTEPRPVDVRVVATTSERLNEQVRNDHFRPALSERLQALSLRIPPLRDRRADIPLLVRHFLDTLQPPDAYGPRPSITHPAMEALLRYDWPGNVRQLRNELERVLVHVASEPVQTIDRDVLLDTIVEDAQSSESAPGDERDAILHPNQSLEDVLARTEATVIKRVLQACDGQVTASAEVLGLSRQGLYKKMKRLGIDASDFQPESDPAPISS